MAGKPKITFIAHEGAAQVVEAELGESLMECAVHNLVRGIYADCFGDGGCATCQVYVDPTWYPRLGEACERERSTLRFAFERAPNSRLSCYIEIAEELDGLVVRLPERQF